MIKTIRTIFRTKPAAKQQSIRLFICLLFPLLLLIRTACAAERPAPETTVAVDPVGHSENFSAVLYDNTNGLPTSEANDIAQTSEGFLWIGSYSGLIRYDGSTFERMDSTTGVGSVVCLHVDRQDRLWIGTNDSGVALMERGEFRLWDEDDGLGSDKICDIIEDTDGTIYVGTASGITRITPDLELHPVDDPRIANVYLVQMFLGKNGLLYCLSNEDDYFTLRDGELIDYIDHTNTGIQDISSIYPDPDAPGQLYIGTGDSGFYHGSPNLDPGKLDYVDISPLFSVIDIQKLGDRIWICARNGIGVLDSQGFHHLTDLPMNNSVNHVMADYEGNLWFTSSRQGVMKLVSNQFSDLFARYALPPSVVNSTCIYDGKLFVATDTGLLVLDEKEQVSSLPLKSAKTASGTSLESADLLELLNDCRIRSVIRDSRNRLWISTWRGYGLLRYDGKSVTAFTEAEGLHSGHIRAVCETADGSMLVAETGGMSVIKGNRVTAGYGSDDGIINPETLSVCAAPNGDALLGSNGGGIYIINKDGVRCIGKKDGLTSGIVMRVKYDPAHDVFWLITSNSIAYMTTDYQVTTVRHFPYSNNFDLYENKRGDMWILSSNGIYVLPCEELLADGRMKPVHYSMANGLPCTATSNSYSELTQDGDLYISGSSGVAKVNIEASLEEINDLKQAVPYIDADGARLYPDETGGFTLSSDVQKLTVYPFVYNYSLTDPQVSYRLEGFDRENVTVNRSDLAPVSYTNLSGGSYRFVMNLKDAMGRGNRTLSVSIIKKKAIHEQIWFYILMGLCAVLLIDALVRRYIRRKMLAMEKKHREEAERERISSELQMAGRIQGSMLPHVFPPFPDRSEFDIYATMDPAREVGGDFYDFYLIDDDHLCLVIADVSGKGIPAALFMMVSKAILNSFGTMSKSAASILTRTNEILCSNNNVDMFVTVWLGILEISTGKLVAANAGHEYPVIKKEGGPFELLKDRHGLVIGGMDGVKYKEYELHLSPGDKLFVYTDGVPEATDADNHMFGTDRMVAALNRDPAAAPPELLKNVRKAVDTFVNGAEQFDDLTMLCLEYKG